MIKVRARGLDGFQHDLEVSRDRFVSDTRSLMGELASEAAADARSRAKRGMKTGASMNSIRAVGPVIRAGDDVPWYGFADFGGSTGRARSILRTYIKGGRWLFPAVRDIGVVKRAQDVVERTTKGMR